MRWSPERHTFALPSGECRITLQDVNMLLDVQISGEAVIGKRLHVWDQFERLLGVHPPTTRHGSTIRTIWLQTQLDTMSADPTYEQLMQYLRMFLLYFLGRFLPPDKSGDHLYTMYLPLLENIDTIKSCSWGSAGLASLYRGMCEAITSTKESPTISGLPHFSKYGHILV
jgi:hypothetical protein